MALDFPASPAFGDVYNVRWQWDGVHWAAAPILSPDAPDDGLVYGRRNHAWIRAVSLAGDQMTGPLTLYGDPVDPLSAVPKRYVDNNFLRLSGGTMTGNLTLAGDPTTAQMAATRAYVDSHVLTGGGTVGGDLTVTGVLTVNGSETVNGNLQVNGNITATGDVIAHYIRSHTNIDAEGYIHADGDLDADGNIHSDGTIDAAAIRSSGGINAVSYFMSDQAFAQRTPDGATAIYDYGGQAGLLMYGEGGSFYRAGSGDHWFTNRVGTFNICMFETSDGKTYNADGSWHMFSDVTLKASIQPYEAGLNEICALKPCSFTYTDEARFGPGDTHYGLVAQEVEQVLPEMVGEYTKDGTTYATTRPTHLVFVLVNAVRELAERVSQLEAQIAQMEAQSG